MLFGRQIDFARELGVLGQTDFARNAMILDYMDICHGNKSGGREKNVTEIAHMNL